MTVLDDVLRQNTENAQEAFGIGVPTSWDWYDGYVRTGVVPPANFTAMTGYLHAYARKDGVLANYNARIQTKGHRAWVRRKSDKAWLEVQNQDTQGLAGGYFMPDFGPGGAGGAVFTNEGNGVISAKVPTGNQILHWWPGVRGVYAAGTVDAMYTEGYVRITDPNHQMVVAGGTDWWRDASAPFINPPGTNNPAGSMSSWLILTDQWRLVASHSLTNEEFVKSLPPTLKGTVVEPPPPPPPPPVGRLSGDSVNLAGKVKNFNVDNALTAVSVTLTGGAEFTVFVPTSAAIATGIAVGKDVIVNFSPFGATIDRVG